VIVVEEGAAEEDMGAVVVAERSISGDSGPYAPDYCAAAEQWLAPLLDPVPRLHSTRPRGPRWRSEAIQISHAGLSIGKFHSHQPDVATVT
jgi:hypothetical protein